MGQMKRIYTDIQEHIAAQPLDFDNHNPTISDDNDWWRDQDTDMESEELRQIESLADIEQCRLEGYA
jgi:hypothetical protein